MSTCMFPFATDDLRLGRRLANKYETASCKYATFFIVNSPIHCLSRLFCTQVSSCNLQYCNRWHVCLYMFCNWLSKYATFLGSGSDYWIIVNLQICKCWRVLSINCLCNVCWLTYTKHQFPFTKLDISSCKYEHISICNWRFVSCKYATFLGMWNNKWLLDSLFANSNLQPLTCTKHQLSLWSERRLGELKFRLHICNSWYAPSLFQWGFGLRC